MIHSNHRGMYGVTQPCVLLPANCWKRKDTSNILRRWNGAATMEEFAQEGWVNLLDAATTSLVDDIVVDAGHPVPEIVAGKGIHRLLRLRGGYVSISTAGYRAEKITR